MENLSLYRLHFVFVINLTLKVFVLPLEGLQMIQGFFIGVLHLKKLCTKRTGLFLSSFQLCLAFLILLLPLGQNLGNS